jgi:hypothetical protein
MEAWLRQTPDHDGIWETTWFQAAFEDENADWVVTCDEPPPGFQTRVPRERRVLFVGEPTVYKRYPTEYLNQYGFVVGPGELPTYRGVSIRQHGALPWHYGKVHPKTWSELAADKFKCRPLSVFCSEKTFTPQQRKRLDFVERLERHFEGSVCRYGNGIRQVADKAQGLDDFRYHIVLENNLEPGFWTEKLADCYLAHSFPLYAGGCIPAGDFDVQARVEIDLTRPEEALRIIERTVDSGLFEQSQQLLREQRRRVMYEHNFFAVAHRIINRGPTSKRPLAHPEGIRQSGHFTRNAPPHGG